MRCRSQGIVRGRVQVFRGFGAGVIPPPLPEGVGAHTVPQTGQVGLHLRQHWQPVLRYQPVSSRYPLQGGGQVAPFFFNQPQLPVSARRPQHVAHFLKGDARLVIPVVRLLQIALFVIYDAELPRFDADAAGVSQALAVLHSSAQPFVGFVGYPPRLGQGA